MTAKGSYSKIIFFGQSKTISQNLSDWLRLLFDFKQVTFVEPVKQMSHVQWIWPSAIVLQNEDFANYKYSASPKKCFQTKCPACSSMSRTSGLFFVLCPKASTKLNPWHVFVPSLNLPSWLWRCLSDTTPYARSFRRRFFMYNYTVNHPHTNIILSWFSIPLVLKCAAKILDNALQIKI